MDGRRCTGYIGHVVGANVLPAPGPELPSPTRQASTLHSEAPDVRVAANRPPCPAAGPAGRPRPAGGRSVSGAGPAVSRHLLRPLPQREEGQRRAEPDALHLRRETPGGLPAVGAR